MKDIPPRGSAEEIERFKQLQVTLELMFQRVVSDTRRSHTAVIIPSLSLHPEELAKVKGASFYEERLLCMLMLLRQPRMRIILVTSQPIHPTIIDYYLHLLSNIPASHARRRLTQLSTFDTSQRPLTLKILERPNLLTRITNNINDVGAAHLVCFNSTALERSLAVALDIPLYSVDPDLLELGTKSGSRKVFREAGVEIAPGFEDLQSADEVAESLTELWDQDRGLRRAVVKLNEGFSGEGNAVFEYTAIQERLESASKRSDRVRVIESALPNLRFEAVSETWDHFSQTLTEMGGVVEAWLDGQDKKSPSVQCRVTPIKEPQAISTHDQILGGPSGQVFLGCEFPANSDYRLLIQKQGQDVAQVLANKGVIGRFAVDFIVMRDPETQAWKAYGIELNLRKGGTTHPFLMLKFLTDGRYYTDSGKFYAPSGLAKFYLASDNVASPEYIGLHPDDLIDISVYHNIHFNPVSEQGVVFHLIGPLSRYGKTGVTCIGNTLEEAKGFYQRTIEILALETQKDTPNPRMEHLP